jgi:uncharacterized flavoprotein (TIGR03862 family)
MDIAIIGGGPAGMRAAEVAAAGRASVTLYDAKASVGRKFLIAGKGGLNLTNAEEFERFTQRYTTPGLAAEKWRGLLSNFEANALREWAAGLGVETFAASTGRVYPKELKAAPLLRRWVKRLRDSDVKFEMHHRWSGLVPGARLRLEFQTPNGSRTAEADAVILALGGGSWPETGSDGAWTEILRGLGVEVTPLVPANCGWEVAWPQGLPGGAEGKPLKNISVRADAMEMHGELLVTRYGLEGGAIYQLCPALRAMREPAAAIDFKPSFTVGQLVAKMSGARGDFVAEAQKRWRLSDAAAVLVKARGPFESVESLAAAVKNFTLPLVGPRPLAEAISSAGGVCWSGLDEGLMLRRLPGVFVAGEMIDWEAPTGGYLIQGCFATGDHAARAALTLARLKNRTAGTPSLPFCDGRAM